MLELNNVTIVAVACIRPEKALAAIKYSMSNINFNKSILLTDSNISDTSVNIIKIPKLNYEEYNKFIVFELWKYIDTSHCLIVQDDGFVIDYSIWNNDWLDYDYIGAPFNLPHDEISYRDDNKNIVRVGNGGFSLRSKKLLKLASDLNMEWKSYFGYYNEDGWFCCHNRSIYESNNCKWAPLEVAIHFSREAELPENQNISTFGFHGKFSKYASLI